MTHNLKLWPQWFDDVDAGRRPFDIRRDDRRYQVGDQVLLREWDPKRERFTGRELERTITTIHRSSDPAGADFVLRTGYVVLGYGR